EKRGERADVPPRFLHVFSDRTRGCWDPALAKVEVPAGINVVFVDVGVENPRDLAIDKLDVTPATVAPGGKLQVRASVRATGGDLVSEATANLENEPDPERLPDKQQVKLSKGDTQLLVFDRAAPAVKITDPSGEQLYQLTVRLTTSDALPGDNLRYATFAVRERLKVLTLVQDKPETALFWKAALTSLKTF